MWLAKNMKRQTPTADADQGISTIVSDQMGVVTRGEVRQLPIYLYSSGSSVYLRKNGAIELSGRVSIKGTLVVNGQTYKPCSCGEGGLL